jgi:hypothetical protein
MESREFTSFGAGGREELWRGLGSGSEYVFTHGQATGLKYHYTTTASGPCYASGRQITIPSVPPPITSVHRYMEDSYD